MIKDLVSIIIPCYNGEEFIKSLFLSISNQSYKNIEVILINDVSIDNTDIAVNKYKYILEKENIVLKYEILKEKGYASGAVNRGLKLIEGEYFMLIDCDDYIYPNNVARKIEFLKNNRNYAWVMSQARIVDGLDKNNVTRIYVRVKSLRTKVFFKDLIWGKNVFYTPGIYMYRTDEYFKINPNKEIYISKGGQNYQMLLPMAERYKIGYIKEVLFDWYEYPNSHSHKIDSYKKHIDIINGHYDIIYNTVKTINNNTKYIKIVDEKRSYSRLFLALQYNELDDFKKLYNSLKINNKITLKIRMLYLGKYSVFFRVLFSIKGIIKYIVLSIIRRIKQ